MVAAGLAGGALAAVALAPGVRDAMVTTSEWPGAGSSLERVAVAQDRHTAMPRERLVRALLAHEIGGRR
jgi:NADPH-dependent 2,4-dienoyl-CoA reductase/sulfur reductase-like enzyme